ncbi:MAG TPA: hypothetical protein VFG64_07280 [Dongiaceae bacterium]|nr:hypothetical protein [Dongiaceae bacterium]
MPQSTSTFDWGGLWADLLKSAGTGLLVHDGSDVAQAALAGLKVFDQAQQRRQRAENPDRSPPWPELSPAERAAFARLSPEEQRAFLQELADIREDSPVAQSAAGAVARDPDGALAPVRRQPMSANPFDGWPIGAGLPFGASNRPAVLPRRGR